MVRPDLSGCTIWLTRPEMQALTWRDALVAAGAAVIIEPLLTIAPPDEPERVAGQLDCAENADFVIATSANAVAGAARLRPRWHPRGRLIAVGPATANALARQTDRPVATPETFDSEGVLAMPELADVPDRTVAILAGHGGRAVLGDALAARGARVDKLALYRRAPVEISPARLDELIDTADVLVVTSLEAWRNLIGQLTARQRGRLACLRLVAASRRVVQQAEHSVEWSVEPGVIERMDATGAVAALDRIWPARQ